MNRQGLRKRAANVIENGTGANDDGQPPIRRSARIADRESAMKVPTANIIKPNKTARMQTVDGTRDGERMASRPSTKKSGLSESSSNGQNGTQNGQVTANETERNKKAAMDKKNKEEAEAKRKEEEEKEKKIKKERDQNKFDEEAAVLYNELNGVITRPPTSEGARQQLALLSQLIVRLNEGISKASDEVGTAIMDYALGDARQIKGKMENRLEKLIKEEEEERKKKEEEERKKKEEEERKKKEEEEKMKNEEQERKKKEKGEKKEEEERMKKEEEDERKEKNRLDASMIDKECKICFDEIQVGVGCMLCMQVLGCKACVNEWLKKDKSCPNCRRQYTRVSKQVKKVEQMNDPISPIRPSRRSSRGHALPIFL